MKKPSSGEETFAQHVRAYFLPEPVREYRFHPTRKWRFDFAWVPDRVAVEIEGGIWIKGAHTRGAHFESDAEKYAEATILGWRVFRFSTGMVKRGKAIELLMRVIPPNEVPF